MHDYNVNFPIWRLIEPLTLDGKFFLLFGDFDVFFFVTVMLPKNSTPEKLAYISLIESE